MKLLSFTVLTLLAMAMTSCSFTFGYTDPNGRNVGVTVTAPEKMPPPKSFKK